VIARVQSVVRRRRRTTVGSEATPVFAGELEMRPDQFQGFVNGQSLGLTRREYQLLAARRRRGARA
jgi:DNA-binding response OmpR family regulator